jgi:hypothetical protein
MAERIHSILLEHQPSKKMGLIVSLGPAEILFFNCILV